MRLYVSQRAARAGSRPDFMSRCTRPIGLETCREKSLSCSRVSGGVMIESFVSQSFVFAPLRLPPVVTCFFAIALRMRRFVCQHTQAYPGIVYCTLNSYTPIHVR